jgi:transcriptional regulator with XRE-family HTH domain
MQARKIKKNPKAETRLSQFIDERLEALGMSWTYLMRQIDIPKATITRIRNGNYILSPRECDRVALALGVDWAQVWVAAGHLSENRAKGLRPTHTALDLWRLTEEEAQILQAFRLSPIDSRTSILSAIRGFARAGDHFRDEHVTNYRKQIVVFLDFVNEPRYFSDAERVCGDGEKRVVLGSSNDPNIPDGVPFNYLEQGGLTGVIRWALKREMSPVSGLSDVQNVNDLPASMQGLELEEDANSRRG